MKLLLLVLSLMVTIDSRAQDTLRLKNPSFEDEPQCGTAPTGWYNCGSQIESPVDIQPGCFYVTLRARHGKTYLGMVVRDNDTWEAVSQQLTGTLEKDSTYSLSLWLAQSRSFKSISRAAPESHRIRIPDDLASFDTPVILIVWGGNEPCDKREKLFVTPPIDHTKWQAYEMQLSPKENSYRYLSFEAYYQGSGAKPYNGNVLIDNCSEIIRMERTRK